MLQSSQQTVAAAQTVMLVMMSQQLEQERHGMSCSFSVRVIVCLLQDDRLVLLLRHSDESMQTVSCHTSYALQHANNYCHTCYTAALQQK
jgi:hypothetical protein